MIFPVWGQADSGVYFIALGLNSPMMAEFLAWWMPVNLCSFLVFTTFCRWTGLVRRFRPGLFTLWHLLWMTMAFYPVIAGVVLAGITKGALEAWKTRHQPRYPHSYLVNKDVI